MKFLLLGSLDDPHLESLCDCLAERGHEARVWDTETFPFENQFYWDPFEREGKLECSWEESIRTFDAGFWWNLSSPEPSEQDRKDDQLARRDAYVSVQLLLQHCPFPWVNSYEAFTLHRRKPVQLDRARRIGLPVPETQITNDPETVLDLLMEWGQAVLKPVYIGDYARVLANMETGLDQIEEFLKGRPTTCQEFIPGENVRTYVWGDSMVSAQIHSEHEDYRRDEEVEIEPHDLPSDLREKVRTLMDELNLEWTAMDWRLSEEGTYYFLEANFSPLFLYFGENVGVNLTAGIVDVLQEVGSRNPGSPRS